MARKRYIQHPQTYELIPAEEYVRPSGLNGAAGPTIIPDIKPFVTVCGDMAGKEITSRKALREFEKRNGLVQVGSERNPFPRDAKAEDKRRYESVKRNLMEVHRDLRN